jgi:ABC-type sugar transport system ATPase subunit
MTPEPLVEVSGLTKHFGAVRAVRDVSLTLRAGEILTLAGENGSGKSTLIKLIAGVHAPDAGTIAVSGGRCRRGTCAPPARPGSPS